MDVSTAKRTCNLTSPQTTNKPSHVGETECTLAQIDSISLVLTKLGIIAQQHILHVLSQQHCCGRTGICVTALFLEILDGPISLFAICERNLSTCHIMWEESLNSNILMDPRKDKRASSKCYLSSLRLLLLKWLRTFRLFSCLQTNETGNVCRVGFLCDWREINSCSLVLCLLLCCVCWMVIS